MKNKKLTAEDFYKESLKLLVDSKIPFLLGGSHALKVHTGIVRPTKDLDMHCKASDYPLIMRLFLDKGYKAAVDERWLLKVSKEKYFIDFIFNTMDSMAPVDDTWFDNNPTTTIFDVTVPVVRPEELMWSKSFRQERLIYEGPDIFHILLKQGTSLDWKRILTRMEAYWDVLFAHIINFRFIYPGERNVIPRWVTDELNKRYLNQYDLPLPVGKICRGRIFSPKDYEVDINEWDYSAHTHII